MPLSSLHKGTIVSAPSPLLSKALRVTCLRVVLGRYQRRSLTFFCLCPGICSQSHPLQGTQTAKKAEASLRKSYPPCTVAKIISKPSIIVDMHGTILVWCLPGMLKDSQQVSVFACPITRSNNMYLERNDDSNGEVASITRQAPRRYLLV